MNTRQSPGLSERGRLIGQRIAVVEDHALLAQSLRFRFAAEGAEAYVVDLAHAGDGDGVVAACLRYRPDVVLLDLDLGVIGDGAELIAPLASKGPRVIVLTGSTDCARLGGCLEAGAIGLIQKTEELNFLVDQVRRAGAGESLLGSQRRLDLVNASRRQRVARRTRLAPFDSLTERESDVLAALGRGRQVDEISRELFVSTATVRTHVRSILLKLDVRSQLTAVARARDAGWQPTVPRQTSR